MEKFIVVKDFMKKVPRFGLTGRKVEFKIKPVPNGEDPIKWTKGAIEDILKKGVEGVAPSDQVGINFCSKDFTRGDGWINFKPASGVTFDDVWKMISGIYQSNSAGLNTETFCLGITSVQVPAGKGRGGKYNTFMEECGMRKGIVAINNKDNMCLPRALVVAIAHADKDPNYTKIRRDIGKIQTEKARVLAEEANVVIPNEGAGIPELGKFQQYLVDYQIVVYQYGSKGRDLVFKGEEKTKKLHLLYHQHHYNVITSLTAAFCCDYYCEECNVPYDHKKDHRCGGTCAGCYQNPSCPTDNMKIKCPDCLRSFRGPICFENHKKPGSYGKSSVCESIRKCPTCLIVVKSDRPHNCGEKYCSICKKHQPQPHHCYMQQDTGCPSMKNTLFVFYDLETRQEKKLEDGTILHEPNLCVYRKVCDRCIDKNNSVVCQKCGERQKVIKDNVIAVLLRDILVLRKQFKDVVVIAHNGGGFDHQFILDYILQQTDLTPELITRGTKLVLMSAGNVKFLDSLNYFPMALAKLPKAFGLNELKKGYFPHLFNTVGHQKYVGPMPSIEYYDPDNMKVEDREKFVKWYQECVGKNYMFDFEKEFVDYCVSDVDILTQACLKFRKLMIDEGNVCPFTEASTLPSACNKIFRRNFLQPETIGIIPKNGYRFCDNQSKIALQWLLWVEQERGVEIIHAAKQQESIVAGCKVDGYCRETNQVFEFHGCYYHGCPRCYRYDRQVPLKDDPTQTLDSRHENTLTKTQHLIDQGYEVIEMWECDFRRNMSVETKQFVEDHPLLINLPLNPRDAFYGGRTENMRTYYKCREGETIKYVDVCSLYPWVNKYGKYPVGHPEVIVGSEKCSKLNLFETDGLIKCKILPPQQLTHPVLPVKLNDKLMFVLCYACAKVGVKDCGHSDEERAICGTWVIDEVVKALEKGYQVLDIQEVWKYQITQYNPETKQGGLFNGYISKFLKIKQESSGWPSYCTTPESKDQYVREYLAREGVTLDPEKVSVNPGLRQLGKAVITSFWGKLGQRENQGKTAIVNKPEALFSMLTNPATDVNSILPVNDDTLLVNWSFKDEAYDILPTVNVCLAAYTTAQARLKLYSYLEKVGDNAIYTDTDSVIYLSKAGQEEDIPLGNFLGEMTDELEGYGEGSYIDEFVSGGPKNYAYRVYSPKSGEYSITCKVKGLSLNYNASQTINFETIKSMVLTEQPEPIPIIYRQIRRTADHKVITTQLTKLYRPLSTKRKFDEEGHSLPFGYKKARL
ncbi:uncharacterized protein LOC115886248 [Sitophilus oryzae]|uniref:DNA-directed DNA polymerase n=1 Tax=Sitophilus oryzae TaxID=7048 RepID=A0A6J2YDD5_SITOR|nr:uncharacterized protein LOC115886248 [Sitophilus oryzae]